jgi:hypothetical protein
MSHIYEEQETLWYYNIPDLSRDSWDGIKYESVRYGWDELDYRFSVEYNSVPEPSSAGLFIGLVVTTLLLYKKFKQS